MTSFKIVGTGPAKVLLLPGLMGTRDGFDAMLAYADLARFQYAVLDYRGYGGARDHPGPFTLAAAAADAVALAGELGWKRLLLAGHSVGALIAQLAALAMPEQVCGLVSIAGMSGAGGVRDARRRQLMLTAAVDPVQRATLVDAGSGGRYGAGFSRALVQSSWDAIAPAAFIAYAEDAAATALAPSVAGSSLPLLLLIGAHDPVNTAARAEATSLQWYRHATLTLLQDAGHYPMIEAPALTVSAIERFAASLEVEAGAGAGA